MISEVLERFADASVLCVGDVMLDRYVYGRVDRVSAEAPIPVFRTQSRRSMLGGCGNVARNVCALGGRAVLVGVTGDDRPGAEIADFATMEPRLGARMIVEPGRRSTVKTRYVAAGQQILRADDESTDPVTPESAERLMDAVRDALPQVDAVVLSDYLKGVATDETIAAIIGEARACGVPVIADPKRDDLSVYRGAALLKPNQSELSQAARLPCRTDAEVAAAARRVLETCGVESVLVSRAGRGLSLIVPGAEPLHVTARALEVYDVSGAGDTVVATLAVALAAGGSLEAAAELANTAAGIVVGKVGTAVVGRDELAARRLELEVSSSEDKIVSTGAALAEVERWRADGLRVGFTNGCFDLLHPGHVSLLGEAGAACDRLIVAINSDDSVRRLKGEGRPVQGQAARAIVLASLAQVDRVVVFSDDTPIPLLEQLRPDVLVKGADYAIDEVVGADVVRAYGGEVKLAALVPGHSSSDVIARMSPDAGDGFRSASTRPSA